MRDQVAKQFRPNLLHPLYFIRNGLYEGIKKQASKLTGDVLDFGCGAKPYKNLFTHCSSYVGVDYDGGGHEHTNEEIEFYYDGKTLPFVDAQFDGIFSSEVFEHLFTPIDILPEINRVLKTGGKLLITCPFAWPEHEKPYDYARYTLFALTDMLQKEGFKVITTDKCGNFFTATHQLQTQFVYQYVCGKFSLNNRVPFLATLMRNILIPLMNVGGLIGNAILPTNKDFYLNNVLLAEKIN